jgi:hypothetical protein
MAKRVGKYKVSDKEHALFTHDSDTYSAGSIAVTGNANIGSSAAHLIGFYDVAGVDQPDAIADAAVTFTSHAWNGSTDPTAAEGNKIVFEVS